MCVPFQCRKLYEDEYRLGEEEGRGNRGRTPNEARRVSTSVLVHARDTRERRAEERAWRFVYSFADERWLAMLGLFVGGEVLPCFICLLVCRGRKRAHDQATITVMLLTRQTLVSSRIGS